MDKIILIGGGGHCKVIVDAILSAEKYKISGIIDSNKDMVKDVMGFPVIGDDNCLEDCYREGIHFCFIAIGSLGDSTLRVNLFNRAKKIGFRFPNIIHPNTIISKFIKIGAGNYVAPGVIINAATVIGNQCIINTGVIIEHDCKIGDFVHIAPGSTLCGKVEIGNNTHIGTQANVIQGIKIGSNCMVKAGRLVIKDLPDNNIYSG